MTGRLVLAALALLAAGCVDAVECRPLLPTRYSVLKIPCNGASDFARQGSDQVILDTREKLETFLKYDCQRGEAPIFAPAVDFTRRIVIVDGTWSPLEDGTCVHTRRVSSVEACVGGVQILYDDTTDPDCTDRLLTGAISVDRQEARGAFATLPDERP